MYNWHTDGCVEQIFKIMIYLTPLSEETGSIELKINNSEIQQRSATRGAWLLFRNSSVLHRGVPGTRYERLAIEITLCRAAAFDLRPRFAGVDAHWPLAPWTDAVDGCKGQVAQQIAAMAIPLRTRIGSELMVSALRISLLIAIPLAPIVEKITRRIAPPISRKFAALRRHSDGRSTRDMAVLLWQTLLRKR